MKKVLLLFSLILLGKIGFSQVDSSLAFAQKIANRMKDTLGLNDNQKTQIIHYNLEIFNLKKVAIKGSTDRSQVSKDLQKIENTRDSLYKTVLNPNQFIIYTEKKRFLVNNN